MDFLALKQGFEDTVTEFIRPVKEREMPRYIVRVNDT
jgi:hypothetical protein